MNRPALDQHQWPEFGTDSITRKTQVWYEIAMDVWSTLQWKEVPVTYTYLPDEEKPKLTNGLIADNSAFHADYSRADSLVDDYLSLDRVQECEFEDTESIAQIAALTQVMQKYNAGNVSDTRQAYYQSHTYITNAQLLINGLGMCTEKATMQAGYLSWCGFDYTLVGGEMNGEPHSYLITVIDGQRVAIDNNPVGTDDQWYTYPPIYLLNGNTGTHFLDKNKTMSFS